WKTAAELQSWREQYDAAQPVVGAYELGATLWQRCITSDLERARVTAATVFPGPIEYTPLLREAKFATFQTGSLRWPVRVWYLAVGLGWMGGWGSQRACRNDFLRGAGEVTKLLTATDQDTLVVSHAGMMAFLGAELRRFGFKGPKLRIAKHAAVYLYEKTEV